MGILTWMTFLPLVGMAVVLCLPSRADELIRRTALAFTLPPLVMGIWLFEHFDRATTAFQYVQHAPWIESYNINYFVGVDGIVNGAARLTVTLSWLDGLFDNYVVDKLVNVLADRTYDLGSRLRRVQTGNINAYLYVIVGTVTLVLLARLM